MTGGSRVPTRATDAEAAFMVHIGEASYCSKSFWRVWHAETDGAPDPVRTGALIRLSQNKVKSNYLDLKAA
jgi:hypothetical protein